MCVYFDLFRPGTRSKLFVNVINRWLPCLKYTKKNKPINFSHVVSSFSKEIVLHCTISLRGESTFITDIIDKDIYRFIIVFYQETSTLEGKAVRIFDEFYSSTEKQASML